MRLHFVADFSMDTQTSVGQIVHVCNPERTLCAVFKGRSRIEIQDRQTAL